MSIGVKYFGRANPETDPSAAPLGEYEWNAIPFDGQYAIDWQTGRVISPLYEGDSASSSVESEPEELSTGLVYTGSSSAGAHYDSEFNPIDSKPFEIIEVSDFTPTDTPVFQSASFDPYASVRSQIAFDYSTSYDYHTSSYVITGYSLSCLVHCLRFDWALHHRKPKSIKIRLYHDSSEVDFPVKFFYRYTLTRDSITFAELLSSVSFSMPYSSDGEYPVSDFSIPECSDRDASGYFTLFAYLDPPEIPDSWRSDTTHRYSIDRSMFIEPVLYVK